MANLFKLFKIFCLLLLATTLAASARLLDEVETTPVPLPDVAPDAFDPVVPPEADDPNVAAPTATLPSGQIPVTNVAPVVPTEPLAPEPEPVTTPVTTPLTGGVAAVTTPPITTPATNPVARTTPLTGGAGATTTTPPITTPATNPVAATTPLTGGAAAAATTTTTPPITTPATTPVGGEPALSFFMHDILGGSNPSGRVVTGIVANSDANNLPFSKANNQIFPINGGVPLNTINGAINNNNYPSLIGLNGGSSTNTLIQNNGNNVVSGNNNQPFVTAGQLPQGLTLNQLMFGSVTVVDNEITEGHELGSAVLGKAQGFYMVSSNDGSSHTLALTALFHGGEHHDIEDTINFFGIHRTATPISHIAIVGGTGKYEKASGYATIETLPHEDQHTTDGLQTITHFTLYLTP